jgi:hypothetical protein
MRYPSGVPAEALSIRNTGERQLLRMGILLQFRFRMWNSQSCPMTTAAISVHAVAPIEKPWLRTRPNNVPIAIESRMRISGARDNPVYQIHGSAQPCQLPALPIAGLVN